MTHTYNITGMTCEGCVAKVSYLLKQLPQVTDVAINLEKGQADVTMDSHVATPALQQALKDYPKYQLTEEHSHNAHTPAPGADVFGNTAEVTKSWAENYKPILLIFGYITVISSIEALYNGGFSSMTFMRIFMAGFFLTFSFFKMLDLKGFANSYAMYDVVAKKLPFWGYIYAFLELALGLGFALNFEPVFINAFTAVLMFVSLLGVLQSVLNKKKIQCACLGAVFNLPMSTVTIIEDGLMIAMSIAMLFMYL
ncbi:heavy-metal-associated domain-containing protein [Flavobacterium subsaxonicum]|uniref:Heavy metal transporter n=1 Tax=Flavobacterium subsaxonicum WB 4.1-42 = DSM 21790 TaxID=1121898 RepID=A0A0A2MTQ3_9FLAO|nr:heavy metal-associated domain-containing protein [Flavobacterium subsaxonicum]KGO94991.1 heavy metal transporter [Flavobacterium subsaxonicum WB 4.1-42 = DSM 21790]